MGLFLLPSSLYAAGTNTESHFVTYEFRPDGSAKVSFAISIKNNVSNIYVKEYSLTVDSDKVDEIKASDSKGNLKLQVEPKDGRTKIKAFFNDVVAGKDAVLKWNLIYVVSNFASKNGEVWEVSIPKFLNVESIGDYQINLIVPKEFGPVLYIYPQPSQSLQTSKSFSFTKNQILNRGVHAAFGYRQIYNFSLSYYLSNPKPLTVISQIPIPADTNYQHVYYRSITPQPANVVRDEDGNYMAEFSLKAGEETMVNVEGFAELFFSPQSSPSALSKEDVALYTRNQPYWEIDSPAVSQKSKELKTAEAIYQYVVNNLTYNVKKGQVIASQQDTASRLGAAAALQKSTDLTSIDFADVFTALCRSSGIPARVVSGYARTSNSTLRPTLPDASQHVWAEYWDSSRGWVAVDPTWGTTSGVDYFNTFDLNHLSFVTYGKSSDTPAPPASYRSDSQKKGGEANVSFGKITDVQSIKSLPLAVSFNLPSTTLGIIGVSGKIIFKNPSGVAALSIPVTFSSDLLPLKANQPLSVSLPPYGSISQDLSFNTVDFRQEGENTLIVGAGGEEYLYTIMVQSFLTSPFIYIIGGLLIVGGLVAFAIKARRLPFLRSR